MIPKLSMYEEKSVAAFFCFEFMYLIEANVASKNGGWILTWMRNEDMRWNVERRTTGNDSLDGKQARSSQLQ